VRLALPLLAVLSLVALSACGGGDETEPVTLAQRVVEEADAPGSKADPVETRQTTVDFEEFIGVLSERAVDPDADELRNVFTEAGFEAAIIDARFYGETHSPDSPHVFSSAIQLESEQGAESALEWLAADSMKPCPTTCAVRISQFDVDGIPDARGVHRSQSAEDIEAVGTPEDVPFDSYEILFTDGPFVYSIALSGPPGFGTEAKVTDIAGALYERVEGAPLPSD
jgi:hypothetical protein